MANFDRAFRAKNGISLEDEVGIFYLDDTPSSISAPRGSVGLKKTITPDSNGQIWVKYGDNDNEWKGVAERP